MLTWDGRGARSGASLTRAPLERREPRTILGDKTPAKGGATPMGTGRARVRRPVGWARGAKGLARDERKADREGIARDNGREARDMARGEAWSALSALAWFVPRDVAAVWDTLDMVAGVARGAGELAATWERAAMTWEQASPGFRAACAWFDAFAAHGAHDAERAAWRAVDGGEECF